MPGASDETGRQNHHLPDIAALSLSTVRQVVHQPTVEFSPQRLLVPDDEL